MSLSICVVQQIVFLCSRKASCYQLPMAGTGSRTIVFGVKACSDVVIVPRIGNTSESEGPGN